MEELIQYQSSLAQAIVRKNPNVPIASALIIAGDIISKEEVEKFIAGKNLSEIEDDPRTPAEKEFDDLWYDNNATIESIRY